MKIIRTLTLVMLMTACAATAAPPVRIKDLGNVLGARDNQLMGFGLVVGLRNSGDSAQTGFTRQAMTNLLSKMGVTPQIDFRSRNVAAVMVTASLPPFMKSGQRMDVNVSSMGDATSLAGGTLLVTPLQGADGDVYAVAQGNITVDQDILMPNMPPIRRQQATAGRIPGGALVEKEVPVTLADRGAVTIVLNDPDFTTAKRVSDAIVAAGLDARAEDAATVKVTVFGPEDAMNVMARIENIAVVPDTVARVVINERTGTIVVGENVRISEVAVSFGGIDVTVGPVNIYAERSGRETDETGTIRQQTRATFDRSEAGLRRVTQSTRLIDLVRALNAIRAKPQELIAILQAMKRAGALQAELEVI